MPVLPNPPRLIDDPDGAEVDGDDTERDGDTDPPTEGWYVEPLVVR